MHLGKAKPFNSQSMCGSAHSANYHLLSYRPGDGTEKVIRISGERDISDVLGEVQNRLFDISPIERARQAAHADAILRKHRGA